MARGGLGRGLGALIPTGPPPEAEPPATPASAPAAPAVQPPSGDPTDVFFAASPQTGLAPVAGAHFAELPVGSIAPNPRQPRSVFDEEEMAELVHSIREIGLLQPVVVRPARRRAATS